MRDAPTGTVKKPIKAEHQQVKLTKIHSAKGKPSQVQASQNKSADSYEQVRKPALDQALHVFSMAFMSQLNRQCTSPETRVDTYLEMGLPRE